MTERPMSSFVRALALRGAGQITQLAVQPVRATPHGVPLVGSGQGATNAQEWRHARATVFDEPLETEKALRVAAVAQEPAPRKPAKTQPALPARTAEPGKASAQAEPRMAPQPAPALPSGEVQTVPEAHAGRNSSAGERTMPRMVVSPGEHVVDVTVVPPELVLRASGVRPPATRVPVSSVARHRDSLWTSDQLATAASPLEEVAAKPDSGYRRDEVVEPQPIVAPQAATRHPQAREPSMSTSLLTDTAVLVDSTVRSKATPDASAATGLAASLPATVVVRPTAIPSRNAALPAAGPAAPSPTIEVRIGAVEVRAICSESSAALPTAATRPAPQPQGFAEYDHLRG